MCAWRRRPVSANPFFSTTRNARAQPAIWIWPRRSSNMTRKALGRGLNALLHTVENTPAAAGQAEVAIELIDANPFQPRRTFSADKLRELSDSIRSSGVVQPVLLRRSGERYQLIAGERRLRAAKMAELASIDRKS